MKVFRLQKFQTLPISMEEAWTYFSNPQNLMHITPPQLKMTITSGVPEKMYQGQIITYQVSPMLGIPLNWVTEITMVKEGESFIDEQRFGPYKFWHHLHTFRPVEGGVEIGDLVHYGLPAGPLSGVLNECMVKKQLEGIFQFRSQVLETQFKPA